MEPVSEEGMRRSIRKGTPGGISLRIMVRRGGLTKSVESLGY